MKKVVFVFLLICFSFQNYGQINVTGIDSSLNANGKKSIRLKKIKFGNNATGTVYFYLRKNNKIFSVNDHRTYYNAKHGEDSSITFIYLFLDDTLVKVRFYRFVPPAKGNHAADFYFSADKLIYKNIYIDTFIPDTDSILKNASSFFIKANNIKNNK